MLIASKLSLPLFKSHTFSGFIQEADAINRCPASHRYAYYNGDYCCHYNREKNSGQVNHNLNSDSSCPSKFLWIEGCTFFILHKWKSQIYILFRLSVKQTKRQNNCFILNKFHWTNHQLTAQFKTIHGFSIY